jgi:AraC-like DNA-binding protein/mannose-6-phosphate isomerase-like protein (cupin superfamily)
MRDFMNDLHQSKKDASIPKISRNEKFYTSVIRLSWLSLDITVMKFSALKGSFFNFDHAHNYKEICYVASGSGHMMIEKTKSCPLKKGSLLYLDVGVSHHLVSDLDDPMEVYIMPFTYTPCTPPNDIIPAQWVEDERMLLECLGKERVLIADDTFGCGKELQNLIEFTETSNRGEFIKIKNYISNFLINALQAFADAPQKYDFLKILQSVPSFNDPDKYMRQHYTEGITLAALAEALHYSPRQCQRIISECMGISFSELLLDLQLTHAKELLRDSAESLEEIAEHSGFKSGKAFNMQFKEREGVTPSRYRKDIQRAIRSG